MAYYKPRLPSTSVTGAWSTDTNPEFQEKLLAAVASLDMSLNDSQAKQLRKIVEDYASYWQAEQASEPVDDARKFSLRLRKAASAFQVALNQYQPSRGWVSGGRKELDRLIEEFLAKKFELRRVGAATSPPNIDPYELEPRISVIADLVGEFVAGCDYADTALKGYEGQKFFKPGEAWDDFIYALAKYYRDELRGDLHASKRGRASKFPRFAFAVQCTLPERFWLHSEDTSKDPPDEGDPPQAFSHAIDKVLRRHNLRQSSKGLR